MTLEEAQAAIGRAVLYQPVPGVPEEGIITSVNDAYVFVRFGIKPQSAAVLPGQLTLMGSMISAPPASAVGYDPIPDLARLVCAAERLASSRFGTAQSVQASLKRLLRLLDLPAELPDATETEAAIRNAMRSRPTVSENDVITVVPRTGPVQRMRVVLIEPSTIYLADPEA